MKNNIIILSGKISSGKSTVANYLVKHHHFVELAFADVLKRSLKDFLNTTCNLSLEDKVFYTQEGKSIVLPITLPANLPPTVRGAMQWWGELMKAELGTTFWTNIVASQLKNTSSDIVISDARFLHEINAIKEDKSIAYLFNVSTVLIHSDRSPKSAHVSEVALDNYAHFDFILENNKSLVELNKQIEQILAKINWGK